MNKEIELSFEDAESFAHKRTVYFSALSMQLRKEFGLLKELGVAGNVANREGWYVGHHSLVEAAVVLQFADRLKLQPEDRRLLARAAMLHDSNKRLEVESKSYGSESIHSTHVQTETLLIAHGVSRETLSLIEGTSPDFPRQYLNDRVTGKLDAKNKLDFYRSLMFYTDNITQTRIGASADGVKSEETYLVDWRQRIAYFRNAYPELAKERVLVGDTEMLHFDIEEKATAEIEQDLIQRIILVDSHFKDELGNRQLPLIIQDRLVSDITNGVVPRI